MNIYDIARMADVSIATVSRVLNKSGKVRSDTREKVNKIIRESGFVPSHSRNGIKSRLIGIMAASGSIPAVERNIELLVTLLEKNNFSCIISRCDTDIHMRRKCIEKFLSLKADAIMIDGTFFLDTAAGSDTFLSELKKTPVMIINGFISHPNVSSTICNTAEMLQNVTHSYLRKKNVLPLFLFSDMSAYSIELLDAYKNALLLCNNEPEARHMHLCRDYIHVKEFLDTLYIENNFPNLIICSNDLTALMCLRYFHENGISCPGDSELICCSGSCLPEYAVPPVSCIYMRNELICNTAVNSLKGILSNTEMPTHNIIPAEYIKRESTN